MRKRLRVVGLIGCGLLLVIAVGLFGLYEGLQHEPKFYREAIGIDPLSQRRASEEMLERTTAFYSDVREENQWQALFTAEQINGWLAVDLVENHSDALPKSARDPRVAIEPDRIMLACRFEQAYGSSVVSLIVEPSLPEPNVLALRIRKARAGMLPVPLDKILDHISKAAGKRGLRLQWRQAGGDPVVFISIPPPQDQHDRLVQIETLRLDAGEIYLGGTTKRR